MNNYILLFIILSILCITIIIILYNYNYIECFNIESKQYINKKLKYARNLPTGLGDRFGVLLGIFAIGYTISNEDIYISWFSDGHLPTRIYPKNIIMKYVKFPNRIKIVEENELQTINAFEIKQDGGKLEATNAYDIVKPLIPYTISNINFKDLIHFNQNYDSVRKEFSFEIGEIPKNDYFVLHIRGGDKYNEKDMFYTQNIINILENKYKKELNILIITDDTNLSNKYKIKNQINPPTTFIENSNDNSSSTIKALYDLNLLSHSKGIIQHSQSGWSSFSNFPSILRKIPLISTFNYKNNYYRLNDYKKYNGSIEYWFNYDEVDKFINYIS